MVILGRFIHKLTDRFDTTELNCDGCGEPYPITHMNFVDMWDGHFCERCAVTELDE
jgi:hypothetical protein